MIDLLSSLPSLAPFGQGPGTDSMAPLLAAFLAAAGVYAGVSAVFGLMGDDPHKKRARKRLDSLSPDDTASVALIAEHARPKGRLTSLMGSLAIWRTISRDMALAGMAVRPSRVLLASALLGVVGYLIGSFIGPLAIVALCTLFLAWLPVAYVRRRRNLRMQRFAQQLPDALDLVGRALKAGHAFTSALKLVGEEFSDPMGPEFEKVTDEINFGMSPKRALDNLCNRVDCPDLRFFVVSVNIQRETGGNLAEIVGTIARLIRERFTFMGRVKVLSAEGRLSAIILLCLPVAVAGYIYLVNPEYLMRLVTDPMGDVMTYVAGTNMLLGIIAIRKMIKIEV